MSQTMKWENLLNDTKYKNTESQLETGRTNFNSDFDKIIFSAAFRRLARKTQVHPLAINDHIHNRLTHSLEVARVGRSLGTGVGEKLKKNLPDNISSNDIGNIVQAACISHDIGNPPFGHTGEAAIRSWFQDWFSKHNNLEMEDIQKQDLLNFEGNAQGFRILTATEMHQFNGGMRLTYATLGTFSKYPWTSDHMDEQKAKFGIYQTEKEIFNEVSKELKLIQIKPNNYCRHPLTHLMELADDFCYGLIDLEDGLLMKTVNKDEIIDIFKKIVPTIESKKQHIQQIKLKQKPSNIKRINNG